MQGSAQNGWSGGHIYSKPRIGPQLPESAHITCKSGGYLPVSGGQLALVMAEVTTTNHCGQNTEVQYLGLKSHTVAPPIMNSPNSEKPLIMKVFHCTICILFDRFVPLNKENLQIMKKLAVPRLSLFGGSTAFCSTTYELWTCELTGYGLHGVISERSSVREDKRGEREAWQRKEDKNK